MPEGVTQLPPYWICIKNHLADKPFPAGLAKEPAWESQQPFSWAMIDPEVALWGQVTRLAELVAELCSALCLCTGSSSFYMCKAWQCMAQVPSWAAMRQPEYFHFDSHLENFTFNDDFFSKEGKTWEACSIWLTVIFPVAFPPWKYLGWWRFAPQIIIPLFSTGKCSGFFMFARINQSGRN